MHAAPLELNFVFEFETTNGNLAPFMKSNSTIAGYAAIGRRACPQFGMARLV
jgi:hypothetical protein